MPKPAALVKEIRAYCKANANPEGTKKYERYFKEGFDAYGLLDKENPIWHDQFSRWQEKYKAFGVEEFIEAGELLFAGGKYEEGALAVKFLTSLRKQIEGKHLPGIGKWYDAGIGNWAHSDVLCSEILYFLLQKDVVGIDDFIPWRESDLRFKRRGSIVAQLGLVRKDRELEAIVEFARPMMHDTERVVHQGIGWVLRECWKKRPELVEPLLLENKDTAPRLIYQYATEKMTKEQKELYRKAKKK